MGIRDSHFFHGILRVVLERKFEREILLENGKKWELAIPNIPNSRMVQYKRTSGSSFKFVVQERFK